MYLVIIILPLLGSIISGFLGRKIGIKGSQVITCISVIISTILSLIGGVLGLLLYNWNKGIIIMSEKTSLIQKIYTFLNGQYLFDILYNQFAISKGIQYGYIISKVFDRGVIEAIGPFGLSNVLQNTASRLAKLDTGVITTYSLYITLGLLTLLFLVFSPILLDFAPSDPSVGKAGPLLSEMRILIIYFSSLILALW